MAEQIDMDDMEYAWPSTGYDMRTGNERASGALRACAERLRVVERRLCALEASLSQQLATTHAEPHASGM